MFNETLTHAEVQVFRARTGGAYRIKGAYGQITRGSAFPQRGSIPVATGKSGTIISTGKIVRGTGTKFKNEIHVGDFLYHKFVVRRVMNVMSDTLLEVEEDGFPTDIAAGEIPLVCKTQMYKAIYAKCVHETVAASLQEAPIAPGNTFLNGGSPISYDASSGTLEFQLHV